MADPRVPMFREAFLRDGVALVRRFLDEEMLGRIRSCFEWSFANPGPQRNQFTRDGESNVNMTEYRNPKALAFYREHLMALPIARFLADAWQSQHIWFLAEEIYWKKGRAPGTPWHQDTSYVPMAGDHWVNCWISLDRLPSRNCLGIVRGSHRGTRYDGSTFDLENPTAPFWGDRANLPRLPDVEAERKADPSSWDVLTFDIEPGDVLFFHPGVLHGGAPVDDLCPQRRTLVLRFFGDQAFCSDLPIDKLEAENPEFSLDVTRDTVDITRYFKGMKPGDPFGNPRFFQLL